MSAKILKAVWRRRHVDRLHRFSGAAAWIGGIGAESGNDIDLHRHQNPVGIHGQAAANLGFTRVIVADKGLQAIGAKLNRSADQNREGDNGHLIGICGQFHAEGAADVRRDDAHVRQWKPELSGEDLPHLIGNLMRMMDGEMLQSTIEFGHDGPWFQGYAGLPSEREIVLYDDGGIAESAIGIADGDGVLETKVARHRAVGDGRVVRGRGFGSCDRRQFGPCDLDKFQCVLGVSSCVRDDGDDGLALPACFMACERMLRGRLVAW